MPARPATKPFGPLRAFLTYLAITVALTWPLVTRMADGVPNDLGDPILVSWILWWNAHAMPFTSSFWNAPAFYPAQGVLAFSEHFVGLSIVTTPIYWLTGNIQIGYNVAFLLTFILSAFFAYLLCRAITGREDAAFIGGLIYGFMPYRVDQLPHMQMLVSLWMPLGLFGLHRYLQTKRARWLAVFGAGWMMQGLSSGYLMLFFAVLIACWILWFVRWHEWRQWLAIGVAWGLASVPVVVLMLGYRRIHEFYGFERTLDEIKFYSADLTGLLQASANSFAWHWLHPYPHAEGAIFPGITAILLVLVSLLAVRAKSFQLARLTNRAHVVIGGMAILFGLAAISAKWLPWQLPWLGLSNTHVDKPLRYGALFLIIWIATHPLLVGGFKRRSAFAFYLAGALLMWMLSLGPAPMYFGEKTPFTGPYSFLLDLPGFSSVRVPARFAMCTALCLAGAGALAFARLASALSRSQRRAAMAVVTLLALTDGWVLLTVETRPGPWPVQSSLSREPAVELPVGDPSNDIQAMHRSTFTGEPIVNGYSGNFPRWYQPLAAGLAAQNPSLLEDLSALGVRQVLVDKGIEGNRAWIKYFESRPDITQVADDGAHRLYRLPAVDRPLAVRPFGPPLQVTAIDVTVNKQLLPRMTDGDVSTRWETGPQKGTEQVVFDLGSVQPIGGVVLYMGKFTTDAPRDLLVEISDDRQHWTTVSRGPGESGVFRAVLRDPKKTPFTIDVGDRPARYIRFSQLGTDPVWYWTIAEFAVLAPPR